MIHIWRQIHRYLYSVREPLLFINVDEAQAAWLICISFIMHIKSFLKKISEIPAVDISNPYRNNKTIPKRHSESTIRTDAVSFSDKLIASRLAAP